MTEDRCNAPDVEPNFDHDSSTGSSANFELARTWFTQCIEQHSQCKASSSSAAISPLPTRLINVEAVNRPFLEITTPNSHGPYLALSYTWGEGERVLTLRSNYEAHRQCLPLNILPRTFADAIQVTRRLRYKHLWIDALCMIQDDDDHMSKEIPKMGDIYRYAQFTITAAGASSSHSGMFVDRDPRQYRPCKIPVSTTTDKGSEMRHITLATTYNGHDYLKSRGWIHQERVLSSRSLIFGKQMSWACTDGEAQETRPAMHPRPTPPKDSVLAVLEKLRVLIYASPSASRASTGTQDRSTAFDVWYAMLKEYSDKELTYVSDNINAVAGLAALFQQSQKSTYAAGLWEDDLPNGLAWYVGLGDERPLPKEIDGPTWAWPSVGKVRINFRSWKGSLGRCVKADAKVLDVSCDLATPANPYGPVTESILTFFAPIQQVLLQYTDSYASTRTKQSYGGPKSSFDGVDKREQPRHAALILDPKTNLPIAEVAMDRPRHMHSGLGGVGISSGTVADSISHVCCMVLHVQRFGTGLRGTLLVLKRSDADKTLFARIGLGFVREQYVECFGINGTLGGDVVGSKETVRIM